MKKTLSMILCLLMIAGMAVGLTACKGECKECVDSDKNGICDKCEKTLDPTDILPKDTPWQYEDDGIEELLREPDIESALENMSIYTRDSGLILFTNYSAEAGEPKAAVLNTESGEIVMTVNMEDEDDEKYSSLSISHGIITKNTATYDDDEIESYTSTIYNADGSEIASKTSKNSYSSTSFHNSTMFSFDGKVYEIRDNTAEYMFDLGLRSIPEYDCMSDKYYYDVNSSEFFIYNTEFALVHHYEAPANAESTSINILANGNMLIQIVTILPFDASEYDVFMDGDKYDLKTLIFNVENGTKTEVECSFYVDEIINEVVYSQYIYNSEVEFDFGSFQNIASISRIVDKAPSSEYETVSLTNDLVVTGNFDNVVPNGQGIPSPIDTDRYLVYDVSGKEYVVNGNGEMIGEVTGASFDYENRLFYRGGRYYDTDLELVLDINETEYSLVSNDHYCELYREPGSQDDEYKYYVLDDGSFVSVSVKKNAYNFTFHYGYFEYYYESGNSIYHVFCATNGDELIKFNVSDSEYRGLDSTYEGNCLIIIYSSVDSKWNYTTEYHISVCK